VDPNGNPCGTVLESAKANGMLTGLVVTSRVTHATPAAFSAHVVHRDMEDDIAVQQIGDYVLGRQVDLMLGGGRCFFLPNTTEGSCRPDNRDLIKESKDYGWDHVVFNRAEFDELIANNRKVLPLRTLGLFHPGHMNFEIDRVPELEPSLSDMAAAALSALEKKTSRGQGFFLMIEGSRIDMAAHNNDPVAHVHEILEYHKTIDVVKTFIANNPDTVMISTSDHETGGFTLGLQPDPNTYPDYLWRPEAISRAKISTEILTRDLILFHAANKNNDAINIQGGQGSRRRQTYDFIQKQILDKGLGITDATEEEIEYLSNADAIPNDILRFLGHAISRRANLGWTTMGHTGVDVNLYATSSTQNGNRILDRLRGNHENTDIGDYMSWYLQLDLPSITDKLVKYVFLSYRCVGHEVSSNLFKPEGLLIFLTHLIFHWLFFLGRLTSGSSPSPALLPLHIPTACMRRLVTKIFNTYRTHYIHSGTPPAWAIQTFCRSQLKIECSSLLFTHPFKSTPLYKNLLLYKPP
jgi:alkaline phosphatase